MDRARLTERLRATAAHVRPEDWVLAAWMLFVSPLFERVQPGSGLFDRGRPLDGILGLVAVTAAILVLVTPASDALPSRAPGLIERGAVGPLIGGLLFVLSDAFEGLDLPEFGAWAVVICAIVAVVALRLRYRRLPTSVRRALVTPFTLVAGGIFSQLIHSITGGSALLGDALSAGPSLAAVELTFFVLGGAVFYAMLVFAPRQVAEAEGSTGAWIRRFLLFVVAALLGYGWLGRVGG